MFDCYSNVTKPKRYIQYNDLVFLGRKSIDSQSESLSLRVNKSPRTFAHGSYVASRGEQLLIGDNTISLQIALRTNNWSEEHVQAHYDFILSQLMTAGKLWAVNTGYQLVWCHAYVTSIQSAKEWVVTDDDYLVFKVEFDNPSGVWYKADEDKTFLEDYDNCDFLNMKAECLGKTDICCNEPLDCNRHCDCCESDCSEMCDMVDMCTMMHNTKFINDFFEECNSKWRIVYNCEKSKYDGKSLKDRYKHRICDACINDTFSSSFISTTLLTSKHWNIAIMGQFKDPIIRLNDVDIQIGGKYDGVLSVDYKGSIRFAKSWECMEYDYEDVPLSHLKLCSETGFIQKGRNTISVSGVTGDTLCVYINYESMTV